MSHLLSRRRSPCVWPSLLCSVFLAAQALAQPAPVVRRADPLDPKAPVPPLRYESTLSQYRPLRDGKPVSWREANDTVTRIGGWRVYTREAQQADPAASAPTPSASSAPAGNAARPPAALPSDLPRPAAPAGHAGHKKP